MKLRGVEVSETICRLFYCGRFAEVTRESFSVVSLVLARIGHVGRDVDQTGNRRIVTRFGNYGTAIAMSDKNAWAILLSEDALYCGDIVFKGGFRFLDDADVIAILHQNVVHAFPTG